MTGVSAAAIATTVVRTLGVAAPGWSEAVLCPGSRSAGLALALAVWDEAAAGHRLHVRIDERTAGFLALGLAKASGRVVPILTTSGTAAANLHPALLEAAHAGVPLIAVTADRPASYVGRGANQTTSQPGMFDPLVPCVEIDDGVATVDDVAALVTGAVRLADGTTTGYPGPVHLDVRLAEPLLGPQLPPAEDVLAPEGRRVVPPLPWTAGRTALTERKVLMVVGECSTGLATAARALGESSGWPVLAEPTSPARAGTNALRCGRLLVGANAGTAAALTSEVEHVLVVGHPTLSRPVSRLLARTDVPITVVSERETFTDVAGVATHTYVLPAPGIPAPGWCNRWRALDEEVGARLDALLGEELSGPRVAREVARAASTVSALVVGSSSVVRDLDLAPIAQTGPEHVVSNRGLAGIDGTVSTAAGVAFIHGGTLAVMGDLTFLHDANGFVIGPAEPRPDLRVVVLDDDGGSIFSTLEQGGDPYANHFERVFGTPHGVDVAALGAALGVRYQRAESLEQLRRALEQPLVGPSVVHVRLDRGGRRASDERIRQVADDLP